MVAISLKNIKILKLLIEALKRKNNNSWREAVVVEFKSIYNINAFKKVISELLQRLKITNCKSMVYKQF
jgi:GTPase